MMARYWAVLIFFLQAAAWCGEALTVEEAVALFRNIEKAPEAALKLKAAREKEAYALLEKGGDASATALLAELKKLKAGNERDDWFEISAAAILFDNGGVKYVAEIAEIWNRVPLELNYPYVFYPARLASLTRDTAYLPMLAATLRDMKGEIDLREGHPSRLDSNSTHRFIWGPMGRAGIQALREVLKANGNETARVHAAWQLTHIQDLEALPGIRELASKGSDFARRNAFGMLGDFGQPDDFALLTEGLKSASNETVAWAVGGLRAYGDLRAVPLLAQCFASTKDEELQQACMEALMNLIDPSSLTALRSLKNLTENQEKGRSAYLESIFMAAQMKPEAYDALPVAEQEKVCAKLREYDPLDSIGKPEKRELTREQFLKFVDEWTKQKMKLTVETLWIRERHIFAVATAADMERLIDLRSAMLLQLYGAMISEVQDVEGWIRHVGRTRYRVEPGVCKEVRKKQ